VEANLITTEFFEGYLRRKDKFWRDASPFPQDCTPQQFSTILQQHDGLFRLVIERGDNLLAAVDRVRSLPLFYMVNKGRLQLSTNAFDLYDLLRPEKPDPGSINQFLLSGFVMGGDTLFSQIKQLQAGQFLCWNKAQNKLRVKDYYRYIHIQGEAPDDPLAAMDDMHVRMAHSLIAGARGRTLAIPLSGGYDSRLLAVMLKRLGYDKVICFTYSHPHKGESKASRAIARYLGYPWRMLEYEPKAWYDAFQADKRRQFFRFGTGLCSSPHIQDWLAVWLLKQHEELPPDTIFVPGHTGGFLQGANLLPLFGKKEVISGIEVMNAIYFKHFNLWITYDEQFVKEMGDRFLELLQIRAVHTAEEAASLYDFFDWRERQAKFIVNSVRVYEFWGYEWRLPMWELDFLEYWRRIPIRQRFQRQLYKSYVAKYQKLPVPVYHDFSLLRRAWNRLTNPTRLPLRDPRYGRFLDPADKKAFLFSTVSTLLHPAISYPKFIDPQRYLCKTNLNAMQALLYLKELSEGKYQR